MADVVYGILYSNVHPVSGETYQGMAPDDESFLRDVISPIYQVLLKVLCFLQSVLNPVCLKAALNLNV